MLRENIFSKYTAWSGILGFIILLIIEVSSSFISGLTNVPLDRAMRKADNIIGAFTGEFENWQRVALLLGWNKWNLETPEQKESRERLEKKKSKARRKKTYDEKKKKKSGRATNVGLIAD